jgi:Protein of unknown function (DUF3054)
VTASATDRTLAARTAVPIVVDALCVVGFVAIGRGSHDEGGAIGGTLTVAAPFLIGLAVAWLARLVPSVRARLGAGDSVGFGVAAWLITLVVGMVLRRTAFGRGTAIAFVIVATLFLCLFLVGWRAAARWARARRRLPS